MCTENIQLDTINFLTLVLEKLCADDDNTQGTQTTKCCMKYADHIFRLQGLYMMKFGSCTQVSNPSSVLSAASNIYYK